MGTKGAPRLIPKCKPLKESQPCYMPILVNHDPKVFPIGNFLDGVVTFDPPVKEDIIYKIFGNVGFMAKDYDPKSETFSKIKIIEWSL